LIDRKRDLTRIDRPLATKINTKRLLLSLGVAGAVAVPLWTRSLQRFIDQPTEMVGIWFKDSSGLWHEEPDEVFAAEIICYLSRDLNRPNKQSACDKADQARDQFPPTRFAEAPPVALNRGRAILLARDVMLGLLVPAFLVLVVPRIARRYLRWLTL
jgi:hypothetical protein